MSIKIPTVKKGRKSKQDRQLYEMELKEFAEGLKHQQQFVLDDYGNIMKVSARGWCYILEGWKIITKDQFNQANDLINKCRKLGYLPIDFVARDRTRDFENEESLTEEFKDPKEWINEWLTFIRKVHHHKEDIAFWESQEYYIQMLVEKIDVKTLFKNICKKYHIPIANAKGWSDLYSRSLLIERFMEAEEIGLKPVLLYYGDFDPVGMLISDKLKKNLKDLEKATGWNPKNLIIDRFGLNYDFIQANNLTWIDNLITGNGNDLSDPTHADHNKRHIQEYLELYGTRKCEANAILTRGVLARSECEKAIKKYLGDDPLSTYESSIKNVQQEVKEILKKVNFKQRIDQIIVDMFEL